FGGLRTTKPDGLWATDTPGINLISQTQDDNNLCNGVTITRKFIAYDDFGNTSSPCTQVLTLTNPAVPSFPPDKIWECDVYNANPNVIAATQNGSGVPNVAIGTYCPFTVTHSNSTLPGCGSTFTIVRTWTVLNWCTGQIFTQGASGEDNVQLIKVQDTTPPVISRPPFTVPANLQGNVHGGCFSTSLLLPATLKDTCHASTQRIITPIGEVVYVNGLNGAQGGFIPVPGLPLGVHTIIYIAKDICGNIDTQEVAVTVADLTAPVAVCDEFTNVSLGSPPVSELFATSLDDGSYDLCCLDSFSVRRMDFNCDSANIHFRSFVNFCCDDAGDTVTVVFRAVDCAGNANDCMVRVLVEEKIPPVLISCPAAKTIDCETFADSLQIPLAAGITSVLQQYGLPVFIDNCEPVFLDTSVLVNVDQCLQGTIVRRWIVTDAGQNATVSCIQNIQVQHVSDFVVEFPADLTVNCGTTLPPTGEPEIFFESCELVAVSFNDELFTVVPDACFKIARTWTVINWCVVGANIDQEVVESSERAFQLAFPAEPCDFDGDGDCDTRTFRDSWRAIPKSKPGASMAGQTTNPDTDPDANPWDGFITYQQTIKVLDAVDPVVNCPPVHEVCILESDCDVSFELPVPGVTDCSGSLTITASGELGTGFIFENVPPGDYAMTYLVQDNCNNQTACQTIVRVKDCKPPTPYCFPGFSVTLDEDTVLVFPAEQFDAGSFDNCSGDLHFSFSPDVTDTTIHFDCFSIGYVFVDVYVTDASGNQDFCQSVVFVNDNNGVCMGDPLISGTVEMANGDPVKNVAVGLNGSMQEVVKTGADGKFEFIVPQGGDYSLTPAKDTFPLNGVTTFDLVLISKHILANQYLDSPYKIIAADANRSGFVSTADLVAIRKMILQVTDSFPNNASWRFLPKGFVFPNPLDPWATPFPEVLNFNDLSEDKLKTDFIGIKVGDVNLSANGQW
ncbi:MAG: hypothetical protein AAB316_20760, partial [Bacteroidota bacterium]